MKFNRLIITLAATLVSTLTVPADNMQVGSGPYLNVAEGNPLTKRNRAVKLLADQSLIAMMDGNARTIAGQTKYSAEAGLGQIPAANQVRALVVTTNEMVQVVDEVFDAQPKSLSTTGVSFPAPSAEEAAKVDSLMTETKAPMLVVMGHVTPAFESYINGTATPPAGPLADALATAKKSSTSPEKQMERLVNEVVLQTISDLIATNPSLGDKIRAGSIYVTGARYDNITGQVHLIVVPLSSRIIATPPDSRTSSTIPISSSALRADLDASHIFQKPGFCPGFFLWVVQERRAGQGGGGGRFPGNPGAFLSAPVMQSCKSGYEYGFLDRVRDSL